MRCLTIAPAIWVTAAVALNATASLQAGDSRLHSALYSADEVYRLRGIAGYQIDLEFDTDERFVGLASGDIEALAFEAQANHLFIKPKAIHVHTNLTVLTTRHTYHFDYVVGAAPAEEAKVAIFALRFEYQRPPPAAANALPAVELSFSPAAKPRNTDYWFCGEETLRPLQAWDDGVHTYLRFNTRTELPALFVRNDDGSESLLNFNVERDQVIVHRIARQFVLRRGKLGGCIVNRGFRGSGSALDSGTVSADIERATRTPTAAP